MHWDDTGFLISKNKYNENAVIAEIYTLDHGKCSGVIYGGTSRKIKSYLQLGNKMFVNYKSKKPVVIEVDAEQAQKRVRETLAKLQGGGKKTSVKNRREKRIAHREIAKQESVERQASDKVIKITEFATAQELATMMDIPVTEIISALMALGFMVTMNQRLEADTIQIIVEEFGFTVEFVGVEVQEAIEDEEDKEEIGRASCRERV